MPVFPGCQILSVCRFSQRIIGAITTSTLEGLTSGLRIAHPAIPLKRFSLAVSTENWWFRQESNLRHIGSRSPPLFQLSYETMLRWAVRTHRATGKELKVKTGSDIGGRRVLSRQLHSSIFRQVNTMGFSYFRNILHKIPRPLFPPPPRGSTGIASRS